jgi:hypothetical protein
MKVIGLGAPSSLRIRFDACEFDVLVDVLREQRADATPDAAETYATTPRGQTRPIDDRHDRLRGIEGLLIQLEEQPHTRPGAVLVGEMQLMSDVARDGAREALRRLQEAHERYTDHTSQQAGDALLNATRAAKKWVATLTALDRVDHGWDAHDMSQPR